MGPPSSSTSSANDPSPPVVGAASLRLSAQAVTQGIDLVVGRANLADLVGDVLWIERVEDHRRQVAHEVGAALVHELEPRQSVRLDLALGGDRVAMGQGAADD